MIRCGSIAEHALLIGLLSAGVLSAATTEPASRVRLPRVLIIGDSISMGYTPEVKTLLRGVADVEHNPGNAADTQNGIEKLDVWLGSEKWDVIHFNWGLHDISYLKNGRPDPTGWRRRTLDGYKTNIRKLVARLEATGARLIWANTTPVPEGTAGRIAGEENQLNLAARQIMDEHGIAVDDLHAYVMPYLATYQKSRDVHYTSAGYTFLASKVARCIAGTLVNQKPPFDMPEVKPPVFPDRKVDIREYGAVGDGKTLNTQAIARAIAACADAGGGSVIVPPGVWLTGAIHLRSNINLHVEADAELRFSTDPKDYLPAVFVRWAGIECYNYSPLIYASGCTSIAITGTGKLEGQGQSWWEWVKQQDRVSRQLNQMALDGIAVTDRLFGNEKNPLRPQFIQPINCRNVLIEGVSITSGPFWTIQAVYCENIIVRKITVANQGPNNDGCNIDSCRNAIVEHCTFATADDAVAIKSGMNEDGWRVGRPTENVIVRHCRVKRGHGGLVIGSDMSGGVRNIFTHDCDFTGSDIGIRLKSCPGRGGVVENIWCRDIDMGRIRSQAITIHTDYTAYFGSKEGKPPTFQNLHFQNVTCEQAGQAVRIVGLPQQKIEDVTLDNLSIAATRGVICADVKGMSLNQVAIIPADGPTIQIKDCQDITIHRAGCLPTGNPFLRLEGSTTRNIRLFPAECPAVQTPIERDGTTSPEAVVWK